MGARPLDAPPSGARPFPEALALTAVAQAATWSGAPAAECAWCGRRFGPSSARRSGLRACEACGSLTTDPAPSDEALARAYGGWYRPEEGRFAGPGDLVLARTRAALAARLDRIAPAGPILDVGSGDGTLVNALRRRGRVAEGLEREPGAAAGARSGDLRDMDEHWSAIVFWHSLEHLPDAGAVLTHAASLLRPRGVLVVAMPNVASLQARLFGNRWLALDLPRHLVHVPSAALERRLGELGLELERRSDLRGGQAAFGWLHGLVGLLPGDLDLYDALRRPQARSRPLSTGRRAATLAAAAALYPLALLGAALEAALGRGGSSYVEARRA